MPLYTRDSDGTVMDAADKITWASDTNIYRDSADTLKTDDSLIVGAVLTVLGAAAFTGAVTGLTKATVGLASVDNTADSAKPVSTAQTTALALKYDKTGGAITGAVSMSGTLSVGGALTANGTVLAIKTGSLNTAVGTLAQNATMSGRYDTAIGTFVQQVITSGDYNSAFGSYAQSALTTGFYNMAVGSGAQGSLTTGSSNSAVGYLAQYSPLGNTAFATTTASFQTTVGSESGQSSATQVNHITTIGYRAVAGGAGATAIGANTSATALGSVAIGRDSIGIGASATVTDAIALGTALHTVNIAGRLALAAGAAGVGGLTIGADVNLYRSAADVLATDDNFNATGNVRAIRTAFPTQYLQFSGGDVNGTKITAEVASAGKALFINNNGVAGVTPGMIIFQQGGVERLVIDGDGFTFGTLRDTNLKRVAVNSLKTDGNFTVGANLALGGGVYLGAQTDTNLYRMGTGPVLRTDNVFRPGVFTTALRPTAAAAGVGGEIYDTTISRPIWSDGTVWRDAAGVAV